MAHSLFSAKSIVDPRYCLIVFDLFTSKFILGKKSFENKLERFYKETQTKGRRNSETLRIKTVWEFNFWLN